MSALVALGFEGGLRPGNLLYLNRGDLGFPRDQGGATRALFVVLRHSKTRERRDAARYQHVRITCATVAALVDRAFGQRARAAALFSWPGNHEHAAARWPRGSRPGCARSVFRTARRTVSRWTSFAAAVLRRTSRRPAT